MIKIKKIAWLVFTLFVITITKTDAQYRFKESFTLNITPESITFLNHQIVVKEGLSLSILGGIKYSQVRQSITLPSQDSNFAAFSTLGSLIYTTKTGISSIVKTRSDFTTILSENNFYDSQLKPTRMSSKGQLFLISPISKQRKMTVINATNYGFQFFSDSNNLTIARQINSEVITGNNDKFYFSSGVFYNNSVQFFYLFEGTNSSYQNIYNYTIKDHLWWFDSKEYLQTIVEDDAQYFLFSKSAKINIESNWQIMKKQKQQCKMLGFNQVKGQTFKFVNRNKIIYFDSYLCLVKFSFPINWISNLQKSEIIDKSLLTFSSEDGMIMVGFSTSLIINKKYVYAYLLRLNQNSTYSLANSLPQNIGGIGFISCQFYNNGKFIVVHEGTNKTGYSQLSIFSPQKLAYLNAFLYDVDDYCVYPNSNIIFIRVVKELKAYKLENQTLLQIAKTNITSQSTINFTCSANASLIIVFDYYVSVDSIQQWSLINDSLQMTASMLRNYSKSQFLKAVFDDSFMFISGNGQMFFYDKKFNNLLVPFKQQKYIQVNVVKNNYIILYDNFLSSASYYVLYEYSNSTLIYKGNFPAKIGNESINRPIIIPSKSKIYMDYYNIRTSKYEAIYYQIEGAPQKRIDFLYDSANSTTCNLRYGAITNSLEYITYNSIKKSLQKYSLDNKVNLMINVPLNSFSSINNVRVSKNQQYVSVWGTNFNNPARKYLEIRLSSNLEQIIYQKEFTELTSQQMIFDCEVNEFKNLGVITYQYLSKMKIFIIDIGYKQIQSDSSLTAITILTSCQNNNTIAYTGIDSVTKLVAQYFFIQSIQNNQNREKIQVGCGIKILAFDIGCQRIGCVCSDNSITIYDIKNKSVAFQTNFQQNVQKIQFLSKNRLLISVESEIKIIDMVNFSKNIKIDRSNMNSPSANSSITINYVNQLIAYTSDLQNITIIDFTGKLINKIITNDGLIISALAFKDTGDLYASFNSSSVNGNSNLIVWSNDPCSENQTLKGNYCVCSDSFVLINQRCVCINNLVIINNRCGCPNNLTLLINDSCGCLSNLINVNDFCVCLNNLTLINDSCGCPNNLIKRNDFCICQNNLIIENNSCVCTNKRVLSSSTCICKGNLIDFGNQCGCQSGYTEMENQKCEQCSFFCQTCQETGFLSCSEFGVWFYVIIAAVVIVILAAVIAVIFKLRKSKKDETQLSPPSSSNHQQALLKEEQ